MNKQTVESILGRFEKMNILTRTDYTFVEYVDELFKFQTEVAKLIFNQEDIAGIRMNEVVAKCEAMAREKNLKGCHEVRDGINALKTIEKEISIAMSGKKGEDRVAYTFQFVERPDASFFRNVYINDESEETEIDAVVITKNGAFVIEVKNVKEDITINPNGRILYDNSTCYHDNNIGEKMEKKRRLLKKRIEEEFCKNGIEKEVIVDSILVFSTPKDVRVIVNDQFREEKYCFNGRVIDRIDNFVSEISYTEEELEVLNQILSDMKTNQKRFDIKFDPDVIKSNFAKAYVALFVETEETIVDFKEDKTNVNEDKKNEKQRKFSYKLPITAAIAMCVGALSLQALSTANASAVEKIILASMK